MERITLREANDSDKALLFDLYERLFRSHIQQIWGWDAAQQIEIFEREWNTSTIRAVESAGQFVGAIQQCEHDDHSMILSFALDAPFQSRGIGSHLIALLKGECKEQGKALRLNVFRTNPRAKVFYRRHGFSVERQGENGCTMVWSPMPDEKESGARARSGD